jgi:hypothetical protein
VDYRVDPLHGRPDVLDVLHLTRCVRDTGLLGGLTVVHEPPVVVVTQPLEDSPTDVPARSREQYPHSILATVSLDK